MSGAGRHVRRAARLALPLLIAACTVEPGGRAARADSGRDTAGAAVADTPTRDAAPTPAAAMALRPLSADSLVALGTADLDDTSAVSPTQDELETLRAQLVVPVVGVARDALQDTFAEARGTRVHEALDIPAARGTAVLSAAPGRVLKLFDSRAGGLMVYAADSTGRFVLLYGHLDAYAPGLADGAPLHAGQPIGTVGTTGNAPPDVPHLHFAIARTRNVAQWWTGMPVDPRRLLQR